MPRYTKSLSLPPNILPFRKKNNKKLKSEQVSNVLKLAIAPSKRQNSLVFKFALGLLNAYTLMYFSINVKKDGKILAGNVFFTDAEVPLRCF